MEEKLKRGGAGGGDASTGRGEKEEVEKGQDEKRGCKGGGEDGTGSEY